MANTFTQLYVHIIFSTKGREKIFPKNHNDEIEKYIQGVEYCEFALMVYLYLIYQYIFDIFIIKCFIPPPEKSACPTDHPVRRGRASL